MEMRKRHIAIFPILIAVAVIAYKYFTAETVVNPETGRVSKVALSPEQESALGLQGYKEVLSKSEVVASGPQADQVRRVARDLSRATGKGGRGFKWEVAVVESKEANAFCLPGGKIVVYTGILSITRTDAGLAAVMGHEMAHATAHHGAQRLFQNDLLETAIAGARASITDLELEKQRAILAAMGVGAKFGIILPFSRDHETEADEMGVLYMARAGYDPRESVKFWQRMSRNDGSQPPEFMSTHPSHGSRIQHLQEFMPKALDEYNRSKKKTGQEDDE